MNKQPFRRANLMAAVISAIVAQNLAPLLQRVELDKLGSYHSRGHGRGVQSYSIKRGYPSSGRYAGVSNGDRETSRRRRQIAAGIIMVSA